MSLQINSLVGQFGVSRISAFGAYFLGLLAISSYAFAEQSWRALGVLWMVGSASWGVGSVLGFLFGLPRTRLNERGVSTVQLETRIEPHTNLEQISDWLTKIIIGAALVQLGPLARSIRDLSITVGASIGTREQPINGAVASGAVLAFYFTGGLVSGYLWSKHDDLAPELTMARISCPGYPDCFIDCAGSGYAYYVEPFGPCQKGCDEIRAASALFDVIRGLESGRRLSGSIVGMRLKTLVSFAHLISPFIPSEAADELAELQQITIVENRRINASWESADAAEIIVALARAASGSTPRAAVA